MSIFSCFLNSLFKAKQERQNNIEQIYDLLNPRIEEASHYTTAAHDIPDSQSDQNHQISSRSLDPYLNDENVPLMMSPPNMSSATLERSNTFATQRRSTSHRRSSGHRQENTEGMELSKRLKNVRVRRCGQNFTYFIPKNKRDEVITVPVIESEIRKGDSGRRCRDPKKLARWVDGNAKQLFTILSYMRKGGTWIYPMYQQGISDKDLPLEAEEDGTIAMRLRRKSDKAFLPAFDAWDSDDLESFVRLQWFVLVPEFDQHDLRCHKFLAETVLPLMSVKSEGAPDEVVPQMKLAGFSTVTAYQIHSAHHNFWFLRSVPEDEHPPVAIKTLLESDNEEEYEKERSILEKLGPHKHPHLIKLFATYRWNDHYHFIFPCAQGNLRNFWETRKHPSFDRDTCLWSLTQMCGLASALRLIHTFRTTIDLKPRGGFLLNDDSKLEVVPGEEKYGRHGDIKPENILWFKNVDGSIVLQITDFGLGRFHGRDSRSNVDPKTVNATPTYEPPECKLEKPVSRAYDIWSVACLYLEFITWLLEGTQAIHDFGDARGERGEPSLTINDKRYTIIRDAIINDDNFFTIIRIGDNSRRAVVRDAVVEWVKRLHTHKNCSDVLHDLLDLVMDHLLRPDSGERITSTHLKDKMDAILGKAKSDQDYLLKPSPRVCLSPAPSLAASRGGPSGRGVRWVETWPTKSSPISPRSPI